MNRVIQKASISCIVYSVLIVAFGLVGGSEWATLPDLFSLALVGALVSMIVFDLMRPEGGFGVDISRPLPLYGLFYCLYYLAPFLVIFFLRQLPDGSSATLSILLFAGYIGWALGTRPSRRAPHRFSFKWVERNEARGLLVICVLGIFLVAYFYFLRIQDGIFFNQAQFVTQRLTVFDSVVTVFGQSLQLPIILLLGVVSASRHTDITRLARRVLLAYGLGIAAILVLSSQTRPAITAILFYFIATRFYREGGLKMKQVALVGAMSVAAVIVVQGVRIVSADEVSSADNQLVYAAMNAIPNAVTTVSDRQEELKERLVNRSAGGIIFLGNIVDAVDDRGKAFYGRGIAESAFSLIPRFIWPGKPEVTSPQIVAQQLLGFPVFYDASLGPVTQFYFEGGWLGVVIGFLAFGFLIAWLTARTMAGESVVSWIVLCFVWSHIANIEYEVVLGVIVTVRNALIVGLMWRLISLVLGDVHRTPKVIGTGAIDG